MARAMRAARIEWASRRQKGKTAQRTPEAEPVPDLTDREFWGPWP